MANEHTPWSCNGDKLDWTPPVNDRAMVSGTAPFFDSHGELVGFAVGIGFNDDDAQRRDRIIAAVNNHEPLIAALRRVIEAAERSLGDHVAPHDCFATGPLTGNPIADLVACPGCAQIAEIAAARAVLAAAGAQP